MWDEGYQCVPVPVAFTIKNGQQVEGVRAPVVQACLGFGRSRNTLRWATGENEVSECLTEVAGIGAVASASIREGGGHDVIWCPVARLGSHLLLATINLRIGNPDAFNPMLLF
jgi:hypothetical protein